MKKHTRQEIFGQAHSKLPKKLRCTIHYKGNNPEITNLTLRENTLSKGTIFISAMEKTDRI